ncbi:MAG: hypothetical protein PVG44_18810, partial [Desulfobacterales bacterium]
EGPDQYKCQQDQDHPFAEYRHFRDKWLFHYILSSTMHQIWERVTTGIHGVNNLQASTQIFFAAL